MLSTASQFLHNSLHPSIYVAPYSPTSIEIDANPDKDSWSRIPWSKDFDDIRGPFDAPPNERPSQKCRTRFKMQWDDSFLYILAIMESDMEVQATFTERNSPIYHQDSDFEVFVDPLGSCHFYKELEMNALNTIWNLMLDKPYSDGGVEYSGRIAKFGDDRYYEVQHMKTSVKVLKGKLNQKNKGDVVWAAEIALAHQDTLKHQEFSGLNLSPLVGDLWRINFSRVEKKGGINWTWQQERIWDPIKKRHEGKVDMHLPDAWGYVQFGPSLEKSNEIGEVPFSKIMEGKGDPLWPAKLAVMNVYYAQQSYKECHGGNFASDLKSLSEFTDERILAPFCSMKDSRYELKLITENNVDGFIFTIYTEGSMISVTNNRLLNVKNVYITESYNGRIDNSNQD